MFAKIVSFEGYENKNLALDIQPLEVVEDFCAFVEGLFLFTRSHRFRPRGGLPSGMFLGECEWCGRIAYMFPGATEFLCAKCERLREDDDLDDLMLMRRVFHPEFD